MRAQVERKIESEIESDSLDVAWFSNSDEGVFLHAPCLTEERESVVCDVN